MRLFARPVKNRGLHLTSPASTTYACALMNAPSPRRTSAHRGLIAFSIPFLLVGLVSGGFLVRSLIQHQAMQAWTEVPARLLAADLQTKRRDGKTTYQATARYAYTFNGQGYESDRVALFGGSDNIGDFQQRVASELRDALREGREIPCYVDPGRPDRSVLHRALRHNLVAMRAVFSLVFVLAGAAILASALALRKKSRATAEAVAAHPDEPWRWRKDWATGHIASSSRSSAKFLWGFGLFWTLMCIPLLFILPDALAKGDRNILIALVFPAIGLGLLAAATLKTLRNAKYGESIFQLASSSGILGGPLAGVVHSSRHIQPEDGFRLTLTCVRRVTTGSGKNRRTREDILWQETRTVQRELMDRDFSRTAIPVMFHLPYDATPTSIAGEAAPVIWRLRAEAATPGLDYQADFEVPVFKTAASSPDYVPDDGKLAPYLEPPDPERDLAAEKILLYPGQGSGLVAEFPAARHPGAAASLSLFLLLWIGAILLQVHFGAPWIFPALSALVGLFLLYGALDLWLRSVRIACGRGRLDVQSGWPGLSRNRNLSAADIERFDILRGMQSGRTVYHDLAIRTADGKTLRIGKHIKSRTAANALAQRLNEALPPPIGTEKKHVFPRR